MSVSPTSPVFCAIDRPDLDGALTLGRSLAGVVGGLKIGLEFITANGPDGVRQVVALGLPVFLDVKFHDIPNTVAGAIRAAGALDVTMLTVHAAGGPAMLQAAVEAATACARRPQLLGVTVLTSFEGRDLAVVGMDRSLTDQALLLADLAHRAALDGVICSPHEIAPLRRRFGRAFKLVVPGIRPRGATAGDQKRTMTPAEAMMLGADILVVGRPITRARDPRAAAVAINVEIDAARAA